MTKCPHTTFRRGTKVHIILADGSILVDHFHERKPKFIILRSGRKLTVPEIRSMSFFKNKPT